MDDIIFDLGESLDELKTIDVFAYGDKNKRFTVSYRVHVWTGEFLDRMTSVGSSRPQPLIDPDTGEPLRDGGIIIMGAPAPGKVGLDLAGIICDAVGEWTLKKHGKIVALDPESVNRHVEMTIMWNITAAIQEDQMAPKAKSKVSKGSFVSE